MKNKGPLYVLTCYVIWGLLPIFWKLLAQVDSSVGGKVAVDLPQGKNLVGAFYQPRLVILDPDTLRTLSDQVWRDGLGEVVKYGCIGDEALFTLLEDCASGGREALMEHMDAILHHCLRAKAAVALKPDITPQQSADNLAAVLIAMTGKMR